MANIKLSALPTTTTIAAGDFVPLTSDPGGTPVSKNITKENLFTSPTLTSPVINTGISGTALATAAQIIAGTANLAIPPDQLALASPTVVTIKATALTDGYIPKHTSDAVGLANSPIFTDGTNVSIGTTAPNAALSFGTGVIDNKLYLYDGSSDKYGFGIRTAQFMIYSGAAGASTGGITFGKFGGTTFTENMRIQNAGNVGIGTTAPANPLAVNRQADDGVVIDIEQADTVEGTISVSGTTVSYNAFVGSHYTQLKDGQQEPPVGAVVISLGEIIPCEVTIEKDETTEEGISGKNAFELIVTKAKAATTESKYVLEGEAVVIKEVVTPAKTEKTEKRLKAGVTFDEKTGKFRKSTTVKVPVSKDVSSKEYFTYVASTTKSGDKRVHGTWLGKMSDDSRGQGFGQDAKAVYLIAQVGLFKIRVTDTNGNIENGDYLETSSRPFEAQKQTGGTKTNCTISKAIIDVKWVDVPLDKVLGYKWKLIPCTF